MIRLENLLFYDVEVYPHNAFVVFKNIEKETVKVFHNDFTGLSEFIEGKTLVGFNNYWYDDHILHYMLDLKTVPQIKALNDRIIGGERMKIKFPKFESLDVFQQIDVGMPSLKKIEGNMGKMILESSTSFDINRPLTPEEYKDNLAYCEYDVEMTVEIYKKRINSYFKPKQSLVEMLGNEVGTKWNTTTLSANVLLSKPLPKWSNIRVPEEMMEMVPSEVVDLWMTKEKGNVTIHDFDCEIVFGFGGLHGQHTRIKRVENVKLLDVASMYPHIILNINGLGTATEKYRELLERRIEVKHKDKVLSDALKLILNSVYGNLKNKFSTLYNPKAALSVCAYGQIALYELCKRLAPFATIININTDGVGFIPHGDEYIGIWEQWEKDFKLTLEEDEFDLFIQKDVNNYIGVHGDSIKCKGGDVARYHGDAIFKNNNARIIDIAIVDKLIYGKDVLDTLLDHTDQPHLFQYVLQAGGTYKGTFDEEGNQYNKVNRVFASKKDGFCLFKKRHDEGLVRFADAPMKMFLWNEECDDLKDFERIVDLNHYYQIITKKLERWM